MLKTIKKWAVDVALSYAVKYATVENVTGWTLSGVNSLLERASSGADAARIEKVCDTFSRASLLLSVLANSLRDCVVTPDEAAEILEEAGKIVSTSSLTDAGLRALVEKAGAYVKERI